MFQKDKYIRGLTIAAFVVLILTGIAGCTGFHFYVWRTSHPAAPTWTYFFS